MRLAALLFALALALLPLTTAAAAVHVWWEGEDAAETNFPARSWFSPDTFPPGGADVLSEGNWLSHSGDRAGEAGFARYQVRIPERGVYSFWCRKFWKHGPFRWRFDRGEWRECGRDIALADNAPIKTHVGANWVFLGEVELGKGNHLFELELLAGMGESQTACFDCFLLTTGSFTPRGKLKPGEKSGASESGWWAFEPAPDSFAECPLDLSFLNEDEAGQDGFVERKGETFVRGDGETLRFWGVNCGPGVVKLDDGSIEYLAKRLAKLGVNLVRAHGAAFDRSGSDPRAMDEGYLERLHAFVAAMKAEGIYVSLSFYFPLWMNVKASDGLEGYETIENKKPFSLLYFDEEMQAIYRAWLSELLTRENPHTGLPLGRDPAIAFVELVNEDSLLFYTFSPDEQIPRAQMVKLEKLYGDWLDARHGSIAKAVRAWGGAERQGDAPAEGRMSLESAWHLTTDGRGQGAARNRRSDQLRFLVELQTRFYAETIRYAREELDCKTLISCSNWHTADGATLGALERETYTVGDLIDRHGYFGGRHEGDGASYSVREGHRYDDRTALRDPARLPIMFQQTRGFPHFTSEIGWPNPNRYKAEFPVLAAAYGALQGIDGYAHFAVGGADWDSTASKFPVMCPMVAGQFPATALLYRSGYVEEADVVLHEELSRERLYALEGSANLESQSLDALRAADTGGRQNVPEGGLDPLAFYVGRVTREVGGGKLSGRKQKNLTRHVDLAAKRIESETGELAWDFGRGLVTIDTPHAQGAVGMLSEAGDIELGDVTISCENDYAAILVVSLDGEPLKKSQRVLVQIGTEEQPFGWRVEGDRIASLGGYPMNVREAEGQVELRGARVKKALVLDAHGHERDSFRLKRKGKKTTAKLPADALYLILE